MELIVPVHQPRRWACIIRGSYIFRLDAVKTLRSMVLEITGWIPIKDKVSIVTGIKSRTDQSGIEKSGKFLNISSVSGLLVTKKPASIAQLIITTSSVLVFK